MVARITSAERASYGRRGCFGVQQDHADLLRDERPPLGTGARLRSAPAQRDGQPVDPGDDRAVEDVPDELDERGEPGLVVLGVRVLPSGCRRKTIVSTTTIASPP